ncbi:monodechloroaminopyrrolnitrin synthase PrnB family protein [Ferrimonas sp. YFM]|uniref:PrnB family protein n=1 Tax=Ferrimonas sp. YFM TaxID=3028878 RepID=UPI0025722152|nr:monodechloroaminopyrrolnitrin synthase PrnB family protein [Ferrimonas sp. YFM]BDY05113.1 tryptophan 2,3-dioxygenase KynA [Ferrimonas sp. YFM]
MTHTESFDRWIRSEFIQLNTELEQLYFAQQDRANVQGVGDELKQAMERRGREHISRLLAEGNTDQGFDANFDLLGNVGMYMAACRRHDLTEPSRETNSPLKEASALALHIGASLGVTPRFATSHLTTHCMAKEGQPKRFTSLEDEALFIDFNTLAVLAYKRAADALVRILPMGITHPIAPYLLEDARAALVDVAKWNQVLFDRLDGERFFHSVRPYYKPFRVGQHEYRGANAGDFAGINVIDMLLGLCQANNPFYSQLLVDKFLYMMPEDQTLLRDVMRRRSFLDQLLEVPPAQQQSDWYQQVAAKLIEVLDAHGHTAHQHHDQLVSRFIAKPSETMAKQHLAQVTASGPPLEVLLRSLAKLRDLRMAANREDIPSRHREVAQLKASVSRGGQK